MLNKDLPKFHETFMPILEVLSNGDTIHYNELATQVIDKYYSDLPQEILNQKYISGNPKLKDRINWAKSYLKQAKMVSLPKRAMVQITDKGQKILKSNDQLTLKKLQKDSDFLAHQREKIKKQKILGKILDENAAPQDIIDAGVSEIEEQIKSNILEKLRTVDHYYFEKIILQLLKKMGYGDFIETPKSHDGGIDGIINQDQLGLDKIYIQAKRYNDTKVGELAIRNFIGAMSGDTTKGIFVTTSTFDEKAMKKSNEAHHKIILIDGDKLCSLMHKFNIGVQVINTYDVKNIDEDFFEQ